MKVRFLLIPVLTICVAAGAVPDATAAPARVLRADPPIVVSAAPKRFDLMAVDAARRRLLAAHSRTGTLTVVDLVRQKPVAEVPVDRSSGVAVDPKDGKYFVGTDKGVAIVDRNTLRKTGFIATPGPADAMVFDPNGDRLYVGHDDEKELWVIDARRDRIVGRIAVPGAPELMAIVPKPHRLYVNIKPSNEVVAIDPGVGKVVAHWSSLPTDSPHGLAVDRQGRHLFVAGRSAKVSVFALPSGKSLLGIDIGPGHVDQIAFDAGARRLYCPSSGRLVIVRTGPTSSDVLGSVPIPQGTHSVAVDPRTHRVWIAYADRKHSYVQAFVPVNRGK